MNNWRRSFLKGQSRVRLGAALLAGIWLPALLNGEEVPPLQKHQGRIHPGVVITRENYKQYLPELKRLLIPPFYPTVVNALRRGWITLPIVEKCRYPPPKNYWAATLRYDNAHRCRVGPNNELLGWVAGSPFPTPKRGVELAWNFVRRNQCQDQISLLGDYYYFDREGRRRGKVERRMRFRYYQRYWIGRCNIPPMPEEPGNHGYIRFKESLVVLYPFDVRGFCYVRIQYDPIDKPDDQYSYIPAIRRLRRFTGKDTCDPLMGSDSIYDDFEIMRQKITSRMTFRIRGVRPFLVPVHLPRKDPQTFKRGIVGFQTAWEIRPLWVLEINVNDSDYCYSKRVIYIEKENPCNDGYAGEGYDQRGRLWRSTYFVLLIRDSQTFEGSGYAGAIWENHLSGHLTLMDQWPKGGDLTVTPEIFTIRRLLREAR